MNIEESDNTYLSIKTTRQRKKAEIPVKDKKIPVSTSRSNQEVSKAFELTTEREPKQTLKKATKYTINNCNKPKKIHAVKESVNKSTEDPKNVLATKFNDCPSKNLLSQEEKPIRPIQYSDEHKKIVSPEIIVNSLRSRHTHFLGYWALTSIKSLKVICGVFESISKDSGASHTMLIPADYMAGFMAFEAAPKIEDIDRSNWLTISWQAYNIAKRRKITYEEATRLSILKRYAIEECFLAALKQYHSLMYARKLTAEEIKAIEDCSNIKDQLLLLDKFGLEQVCREENTKFAKICSRVYTGLVVAEVKRGGKSAFHCSAVYCGVPGDNVIDSNVIVAQAAGFRARLTNLVF